MGYPNGVSLAVISGGTAFTAFGDDVPVQITVTPRFPKQGGGFLTRIIHAATGWVMTSDPDTFTAEAGTEVSFSVPHVDQAGFRDPAQNAYTGWYYEVKVVVGAARGRTKTAYTQTVAPIVGQALVDLDLVPEGQTGDPQSVAVPEVVSVNGMTGAVTIEAGGASDADIAAFIRDPEAETRTTLNDSYARVLTSNGDTNEADRVNAALADAAGGTLRLVGNFTVASPLVIHSDTVLDVSDATVTLAAGVHSHIIENRAVSTVQRTATVTTTAGSADVTADGFSSADIGRTLVIPGAGSSREVQEPGKGHLPHTGVITAVSGSTVTLSIPAVRDASGVTAQVYDRDRNITIQGGGGYEWLRGGTAWPATETNDLHSLFFRRVDNLRIINTGLKATGAKYGIFVGDIRGGFVHDYLVDNASDGVHAIGPLSSFTTRGVRGYTGDDGVAYGVGDYSQFGDISGPLVNCHIEDVDVTTPHDIAKFFSGEGHVSTGLTMKKIRGKASECAVSVGTGSSGGSYGNVAIEDVNCTVGAAGLLSVSGTIKHLNVRNVHHSDWYHPLIDFNAVAVIDSLILDSPSGQPRGQWIKIPAGAVVRRIKAMNGDFDQDTGFRLFNVAGTVESISLLNWRHKSSAEAMIYSSSASPLVVRASNITVTCERFIAVAGTGKVTAYLDNFGGALSLAVIRAENAAANMELHVNPNTFVATGVPFGGPNLGTATIRGTGVRDNLTKLNAAQLGDQVYNTNTALSCGEGWVIKGGAASWKNIYSGATYDSSAPV